VRFRFLDKSMKAFAIFSIVGVVNVGLEYFLSRAHIRNYWLIDLYFLITVPSIALVYYLSVSSPAVRNLLKVSSIVFVLVWVIQKSFFSDPTQLNSALAMITAIFLILISIVTFNVILKTTSLPLSSEPLFWVLTGTLIYYSGSFAVMGLGNELLKLGMEYFEFGWHVNWILVTCSMILYSIGFLCKSRT
jgi:hypothetical protein